ncbi:MAG: TIGR03435 family protein [Ignavibacteriota bacterium]
MASSSFKCWPRIGRRTYAFDITAKYPEGAKNSDRPVMLRTLLEDRFRLATHSESKELPGYALVVGKGGLKIKRVESSTDGGTSSNSTNNAITLKVTSIPMADMADYLARRVGAVVVDKTGAEGLYTFELHWTLDDMGGGAGGPGVAAAAEFAAIQEAIGTLGLHLQAQKVPVELIVVDHIERVPTEN